MGDKYQCHDCKEYFKSYKCWSCKKIVDNRCFWCHFDYMNDKYLSQKRDENGIDIRQA